MTENENENGTRNAAGESGQATRDLAELVGGGFAPVTIGVYPTTIQAARDALAFLGMNQAAPVQLELSGSEVVVTTDVAAIAWGLEDESSILVAPDDSGFGTLGDYLDDLGIDDDEHDALTDAIQEAMSDLLAYAAACANAGLDALNMAGGA